MEKEVVNISEEFRLAYDYITTTRQSLFLTGKAGTGKTTFLHYLRQYCTKNIIVAAPTGVAAINAGGITLHSLFMLPFKPFIPAKRGWGGQGEVMDREDLLSHLKYRAEKVKLLRTLELLVIDEVSMVRADILDAIDVILRSVRRKPLVPFGGVQLLLIGDLYQLPPVAKREEWSMLQQFYASEFFFDSKAVQELQIQYLQFNTIYRQQEAQFIHLLNAIRTNSIGNTELEELNKRYTTDRDFEQNILLTTHNKTADDINTQQLNKLGSRAYTFKAEIEGNFNEYSYPTDKELVLKKGAKVMFTKNDLNVPKRFYNGKIGIVHSIDEDEIRVLSDEDEIPITVSRYTWKNIAYKTNAQTNEVEEEELGVFRQYPLRLAWAITIHKSQGLTFDKCIIDGANSFAGGQLYVALSRCRTLEGLQLISKLNLNALSVHNAVVDYFTHRATQISINELQQGQAVYAQELLIELYDGNLLQSNIQLITELIQKDRMDFSQQAVDQLNELNKLLQELIDVGEKFQKQLHQLMVKNVQWDANHHLQERLAAANTFYAPKVRFILNFLNNHTIAIDSKMVSGQLNNIFEDIITTLDYKLHFYEQNEKFSIANFFETRRSYIRKYNLISTYAAKRKNYSPANVKHPELYQELVEIRNDLVEHTNLPVYSIASNATIKELCEYLPQTERDLTFITGFGKTRVKQYGDEFLPAIRAFARKHGYTTTIELHPKFKNEKVKKIKKEEQETKARIKKEEGINQTAMESVQLLLDGLELSQIAERRGLAIATIQGHMAQAVKVGKIEAKALIPEKRLIDVYKTISEANSNNVSTLYAKLGGAFSYGEIRIALAQWERIQMS